MKYVLEGTIIEDLDTYVRITLGNGVVRCTEQELPKAEDVVSLLFEMQGYYPNKSQQIACSRAARDARGNADLIKI